MKALVQPGKAQVPFPSRAFPVLLSLTCLFIYAAVKLGKVSDVEGWQNMAPQNTPLLPEAYFEVKAFGKGSTYKGH